MNAAYPCSTPTPKASLIPAKGEALETLAPTFFPERCRRGYPPVPGRSKRPHDDDLEMDSLTTQDGRLDLCL